MNLDLKSLAPQLVKNTIEVELNHNGAQLYPLDFNLKNFPEGGSYPEIMDRFIHKAKEGKEKETLETLKKLLSKAKEYGGMLLKTQYGVMCKSTNKMLPKVRFNFEFDSSSELSKFKEEIGLY